MSKKLSPMMNNSLLNINRQRNRYTCRRNIEKEMILKREKKKSANEWDDVFWACAENVSIGRGKRNKRKEGSKKEMNENGVCVCRLFAQMMIFFLLKSKEKLELGNEIASKKKICMSTQTNEGMTFCSQMLTKKAFSIEFWRR